MRVTTTFIAALCIVATIGAQEPTVRLDSKQTAVTVAGPDAWKLKPAGWRVASDLPDDTKVCIDDAMTHCVTVGEVRAIAHADGEIGPVDQVRRDLLGYQSAYSTTLSELDQCRGQLGPLRAQANQKAVSEQVEAWIAGLEKRNPGWVYDRQTGALVKKPEKK